MQRRMNLGELVAARAAVAPPISWSAIFLKAYGAVAAERPELRRCYLPLPRPRLYEHPVNVASLAVERRVAGEDAVLFAKIDRPETWDLVKLTERVRRYQTAPVERVTAFRRVLRTSRLPRSVRRLIWGVGLHAAGGLRARYFGTFGLSVVAGFGAEALHLLSPLTTNLHYGPLAPDGALDVRLTFDHRVVDGAPVARALARLEEVLRTDVLAELRTPAAARAA
jgi:hypothetical protein